MPQPGILVGIPAYGGQMYHACFLSLMRLERACRDRGLPIDYQVVANESLIPRARNLLAKVFLEDCDYSHLLFLDADIAFEPADILDMLALGLPLIGGAYPKKIAPRPAAAGPSAPPAPLGASHALTPLPGTEGGPIPARPAPLEVLHVGTGMMLIHRSVFEAMLAAKAPAAPPPAYRADGATYHAFFDTSITPEGAYLSEDYHFCARYRALGGRVYAAPWCQVAHWGAYPYGTGGAAAPEKI